MHHAVSKFCEFCTVPAACRTYEVAGDALQLVNLRSLAVRTFLEVGISVFISAVHAAVAVVVHRAIADVVLVHEIDDGHDGLRVVGRIAVNLHIEDVSATGEGMVRCLDFRLVLRSTFIIYRHMVGVGVVVLVGYAGDDAELLLVCPCELS